MTDLEITKACGDAMVFTLVNDGPQSEPPTGYAVRVPARGWMSYDPLQDDEQAMALVKKFRIHINPWAQGWEASIAPPEAQNCLSHATNADLNRAICECVAKMQAK